MTNFETLLVLAGIVAVVSRTVTQEAIFAELQAWARNRMSALGRKLAYPLQCQYCFSFWVAATLTSVTGARIGLLAPPSYVEFLSTVFVVMGLANVALISYEMATVKIKQLRSTISLTDEYIQREKMANEAMAVQIDNMHKLQGLVAQGNAKLEIAQAQTEIQQTFTEKEN